MPCISLSFSFRFFRGIRLCASVSHIVCTPFNLEMFHFKFFLLKHQGFYITVFSQNKKLIKSIYCRWRETTVEVWYCKWHWLPLTPFFPVISCWCCNSSYGGWMGRKEDFPKWKMSATPPLHTEVLHLSTTEVLCTSVDIFSNYIVFLCVVF